MTRLFTSFAAAAALTAVAIASPALAAGRGFYVNNTNSSVSVQRVWYAAAGTTQTWEEIYLDYPVKPNTKSNFTMGDGDTCLYDIKLKFSDGYEQTFANVNVCRGDGVHAT
ncbi:hypothetical protein [Sphingomonas sp.]|jgi:hypothetical protein|uniref:hypothetical protein n=1 Tax=Sphingomonas sp. TaxID=28214 RepID=UPI002E3259CE|nr:hypothetical protein [Sphingomonas sp.]HEX4694101.1 hypothetical protein [Sphingomonas sp.]